MVVFGMSADPEPQHSLRHRYTESAIVQTHANTVEFAILYRLELQRGMRGILAQQRIVTPGQLLNVFGQRVETLPEPF